MQGTDVQMSQKEVYQFNVPTFGKGVVFDVGHVERAEQFRFFSEALKTARLQTYVQLMVQEAEAFFAERLKGDSGEVRTRHVCPPKHGAPRVSPASQVDLRDMLSDLIILTASRCLMGKEVREQARSATAPPPGALATLTQARPVRAAFRHGGEPLPRPGHGHAAYQRYLPVPAHSGAPSS